ncbi:MAG: M61 family metallopeptidase [Bryobacteraceae bacterium]
MAPKSILRSVLLTFLVAFLLHAQTKPIGIAVDLTDAPRKILHARLSYPVKPGPLTLVYPKWIPGEHGPTGPIDNLAGVEFSANGKPIPWRRDDVNMYAFHLDIPPGVTTVDAKLDFLATASPSGFSAGASTTASLCLLSWNELLLYPEGYSASEVQFAPSIKVPEGWQFGTALTASRNGGETATFQTVTLETLVDSPVLTGRHFKEIPLAPEVNPKHFLDMAADGPEDLNITKEHLAAVHNLVLEASKLYASHHFNSYHFLLTLSDNVAHFGLEHHQSSDDRVHARTLVDDDLRLLNADLLPHEFTHSWNGKYRRPAGLVTPDYQQPMKGELLWVYEGLTQYLGDVLTARSGLWTVDQYKSYLADSAAELDRRPGRTWRDLEDTAVAAQTLYSSGGGWDNWRRSVDYYPEGELVWLEADVNIRRLSGGKKSLNDFCARFLGAGGSSGPKLFPYTFQDVVEGLNAIQPFEWSSFLKERLTSKANHAPTGGISAGGYRLTFDEKPNDFTRAQESRSHGVNAWYSLGVTTGADNVVDDVLVNSPAFQAGVGPGMKIISVNGRTASDELLRMAIKETKAGSQPIELILENTGYFKVVKINYQGGAKYPHLTREGSDVALLDEILKPLATHPEPKSAE